MFINLQNTANQVEAIQNGGNSNISWCWAAPGGIPTFHQNNYDFCDIAEVIDYFLMARRVGLEKPGGFFSRMRVVERSDDLLMVRQDDFWGLGADTGIYFQKQQDGIQAGYFRWRPIEFPSDLRKQWLEDDWEFSLADKVREELDQRIREDHWFLSSSFEGSGDKDYIWEEINKLF